MGFLSHLSQLYKSRLSAERLPKHLASCVHKQEENIIISQPKQRVLFSSLGGRQRDDGGMERGREGAREGGMERGREGVKGGKRK